MDRPVTSARRRRNDDGGLVPLCPQTEDLLSVLSVANITLKHHDLTDNAVLARMPKAKEKGDA